MVLKKVESTKGQKRGRERNGWGWGTKLTSRTSCFLLLVSLPSDKSGSLPSSSPAHQPGSECQLSNSLGHRPAGCAPRQHIFSSPDCKPSTDVSEGTDGEYPAWAMAQVGQWGTGREVGSWKVREGWGLVKGVEEALGNNWREIRVE